MCWTCSCGSLEERHDSRALTTKDLQGAADQAGTDIPGVVQNIVGALSHFDPALAKSTDEHTHVGCEVFKSEEEARYTLGVAYPANKPDVGKAADGFRDFAGEEALEKAAWSFMHNGGRIGLDHRKGTDGAGHVVESYIYRGPDWPQENGYVVKAGDWLLGVVWEPDAWVAIKSGQRTGFSPQGGARRRIPSAEALANLRS